MRNSILALVMALGFATGGLDAATPKTPPADVGPGRIAWFDITTTSLAGARDFYGKLFDWQFAPVQGTDQAAEIVAGGTPIGTLRVAEGKIGGFNGVVYVQVTDLPASCRKAKDLGGTVEAGFPFNLPDGIGAIALVLDPSGHPVGLYSRTPLPAPRSIALPGAPAEGGVGMDFIAYDAAHGRVWVPAGNTGSVDAIDVATDEVTRIQGFATKEVERNGRKRTLGPSSVAVGEGVVYVGNRGDDTLCALDAASLEKGPCTRLDSMPDAIVVVPWAREVWVTTQANDSIVVLDTSSRSALPVKATFSVPGSPECFAADEARGLVYTNLEDKDRTLAIDVKTRQVTKTWLPGCGEAGPRGLALDPKLNFLFVACTTRVRVLDAGHDGRTLGSLEVGEGVDSIDYLEPRHELFAAAGRAGKLVVGRLEPDGALTPVETVATAASARNAVATEKGVAYLTDSRDGAILVVEPSR